MQRKPIATPLIKATPLLKATSVSLLNEDEQKKIMHCAKLYAAKGVSCSLQALRRPKKFNYIHTILNMELPRKRQRLHIIANDKMFEGYIHRQPKLKQAYALLIEQYDIVNNNYLNRGSTFEARNKLNRLHITINNEKKKEKRRARAAALKLKRSPIKALEKPTTQKSFLFFQPPSVVQPFLFDPAKIYLNLTDPAFETNILDSEPAPVISLVPPASPTASDAHESKEEKHSAELTSPINLSFNIFMSRSLFYSERGAQTPPPYLTLTDEDEGLDIPFGHKKYDSSGMLPLDENEVDDFEFKPRKLGNSP